MIDPDLTRQLAALLVPFLPTLMKTAGKAAESVGEKIGETTWNKAERAWSKLWPWIEKKPEVVKELKDVAESTDDPDAKAAFPWQLKKILADMPAETIEELKNIVAEKGSETRFVIASNGSVAIGGDATGNVVIGVGHESWKPNGT